MDFKKAYEIVRKLVHDFEANEKYFLSKKYHEVDVRRDFIDKLFIALGWDVYHDQQKNPYEQEVKVEKDVSVSGTQKRADYSFTLTPNFRDPKFFVEAKKPAQDLYKADYYFQTVRYGWHKTTSLAVLTDFEEFHILDCRYSPDIATILKRQVKRYHYSEYVDKDKFAKIYWLFSREAVVNNSLEKYAEGLPKPRGKATQKTLFPHGTLLTVDDAFLKEIDDMREKLAKAFKYNDGSLNSEELTEAAQRTIDRLVIIRFLEDKLIEQEHYVHRFGEKGKAWDDFIALCKRLDAKYNSIVFKKSFIDENEFRGPLDNVFFGICEDICHLNSRFLFNEIPIHILGSIYERFLGKVVHATDKRVKVEEKPEVRKAGGVYYTPKYIVDYIVQNTVGKIISGKTPGQIAKMRFADIACGSGSFLISVFDCLLNYHNKYYQQHPQKAKKAGCYCKDSIWVMGIKQKQDILRNNIYGVDIDHQAVEVTQLSLSLKMLEDETTATANEMQVLFHERILPDMSKNIVCGNSLIGTGILMGDLFGGKKERKLNPMDFKTAFTEVMSNGGFDAIIGNPPYVVIQDKLRDDHIIEYFRNNYRVVLYKIDLYHLFFEQGIKVLKETGKLGFITPSNYLSNNELVNLRNYILDNASIDIINVITGKVFKASVDTAVTILSKGKSKSQSLFIQSEWSTNSLKSKLVKKFNQDIFYKNTRQTFIATEEINIKVNNFALGELFNVNFGMQLRDRKQYKSDVITKDQKNLITKFHRPCYVGKDVNTYYTAYSNHLAYFNLRAKRGGCWNLNAHNFNPKILVRQIGETPICSLDEKGYCCLNAMFMITPKNEKELHSIKYILGVLNSSFIKFYWNNIFTDLRKTFPKIKGTYLEKLPIPDIDFRNKTKKGQHTKMVKLVEQMMQAKKQLHTAKMDKDKDYYVRRCHELDVQIDKIIYELYELTAEEVKIIETPPKPI
jgi:hypothetical protein